MTYSAPYLQEFKRGYFANLDPLKREEIFALSTFEPAHWEDKPNWSITTSRVEEKIRDVLQVTIPDYIRPLRRKDGIEKYTNMFYHGHMTNQLLVWEIGRRLDHNAERESSNSKREFDVVVDDGGVGVCEIEVKRAATTNQMRSNLESHANRIQEIGSTGNSLLVTYFPTTSALESNRGFDFLLGYKYFTEFVDEQLDGDSHLVLNVPAPINQSEDDIQPLAYTLNVLKDNCGITR